MATRWELVDQDTGKRAVTMTYPTREEAETAARAFLAKFDSPAVHDLLARLRARPVT